MLVTVELGNLGSKEQAQKVERILRGTTFYRFRVEYGSCAGNWPVSVSTDTEDSAEDVKDMLLFCLAMAC